jgi:hypothetical protein
MFKGTTTSSQEKKSIYTKIILFYGQNVASQQLSLSFIFFSESLFHLSNSID